VGLAQRVSDDRTDIEIDESQWPVLIVTPPPTVTDGQMREYLERHRLVESERAEDYVLVLDLRFTGRLTPGQREMLTDGMKTDASETWCRGLAMIFESRMLRGVLSMIFWVRKPPYPSKVFATPAEAFPWAKETLSAYRRDKPYVFFVQCDATRDRARAQESVASLAELGYTARIAERQVAEAAMFVPRLGPFSDRDEARRACDDLERAGINTRLVDE
jgi:hypothetical protein